MENNNQRQQQAAAAADQLTPQERLYRDFAILQRQKKCFGVASSSWCCGLLGQCGDCFSHGNGHGLGMSDNEGRAWARDAANIQGDFFMFKTNYMLRRKGINSLLFFGGDEHELASAQRALAATRNAGEGARRNTVEETNWQEYYASDQYIKLWFILTFLTFVLLLFVQLYMVHLFGVTALWSFIFAVVLLYMFSIRVCSA